MIFDERRERRKEYDRAYRERHPERIKANQRKYDSTEKAKEKRKIWLDENRDQYLKSKREWAAKNKDYTYSQVKKYREANPGWMASHCAKRRSRKLNATPVWLDEDDLWFIDEVYELASLRTTLTGIEWHVDHIIPLQGRKVCGLHVPWNLQVVTASENLKKGNRCG